MSGEKPPAFQFYPKDWLSDAKVRTMTHEERGIFIDFLAISWLEHGLPSDESQLRRLTGLTERRFRKVWAGVAHCWQPNGNGRLVNPRLERYREQLEEHQERASAAGKAGAEARWAKGDRNANG